MSVVKPKPIESNFFGQSQQMQTVQQTNQNLKQMGWKNTTEQVAIGFAFAPHWLRKQCNIC